MLSDMTTISFQSLLLCWRMVLFFVRFEAADAADMTGRLYTLRTAAVGLNLDGPDSPKKKKITQNRHHINGAGRKKKSQQTMCRMVILGRILLI